MQDLIEAYLSVYEDSDIKSRAKAAVDHQRHGDHGDDDALQKATKAVKKATRYPGRKGPKVTPSLPESYDEFDEGFKRMNRTKIEGQTERLKKSGAKDRFGGSRAEILDTVSKQLDTPDERRFSTDTSRRNKKGVRAHLAARDAALADIQKYGFHEDVDLYDVILDHLLDEGYADTEENAITIMANMSEEWIDEILDEAKEEEGKSDYEKRGIRNRRFASGIPGREKENSSAYLDRQKAHAKRRGIKKQ